MTYLQDIHTALLVSGATSKDVAKCYRMIAKGTLPISDNHIRKLTEAATITNVGNIGHKPQAYNQPWRHTHKYGARSALFIEVPRTWRLS